MVQISPPVHLHVLAIEKEYGGRDQGNIEIFGVHRDTISIDNVDGCHLGNGVLIFGQLKKMNCLSSSYNSGRTDAERITCNAY